MQLPANVMQSSLHTVFTAHVTYTALFSLMFSLTA